jgi:hypothetical protein
MFAQLAAAPSRQRSRKPSNLAWAWPSSPLQRSPGSLLDSVPSPLDRYFLESSHSHLHIMHFEDVASNQAILIFDFRLFTIAIYQQGRTAFVCVWGFFFLPWTKYALVKMIGLFSFRFSACLLFTYNCTSLFSAPP